MLQNRLNEFCTEIKEWNLETTDEMAKYVNQFNTFTSSVSDATKFATFISQTCHLSEDEEERKYYKNFFDAEMNHMKNVLALTSPQTC